MITTKNFTSSSGDVITVKYPTGTIFMRERNYLTVSTLAEDYYLKKITLAGKTINFGRYYLQGNPMTLDVTPYYAKLYGSGTMSLVVETSAGEDETLSVPFNITKIDGYSPYKEIAIPEPCSNNISAARPRTCMCVHCSRWFEPMPTGASRSKSIFSRLCTFTIC